MLSPIKYARASSIRVYIPHHCSRSVQPCVSHPTDMDESLATHEQTDNHHVKIASLFWVLLLSPSLPVQQFIQDSFQEWIASKFGHLSPCLGIKLLKCMPRVPERSKLLQQCNTVFLYFHIMCSLTQDI